jgi:conjugation system TraG family ATPase
MLPVNSVVHIQHFYLKKEFQGFPENSTFLQKASNRHFRGRKYLEHLSFMYITKTHLKSLKRNYLNSGIIKTNIIKADLQEIEDFSKAVERAITFANNGGYFSFTPLSEEDIMNITLNYITGFNGAKLTDIEFRPKFKIGDNFFKMYAINHIDNIPQDIRNIIEDRQLSSNEFQYYKSFFENLGLEFEHNHIVNQFLYLDEHKEHLKELEDRQKNLEKFSKFSRDNKTGAKYLDEYLDEITADSQVHLMRSHINVLTFSKDEKELDYIDNQLISSFQELGITPYYPTLDDHVYYFLSSIPTNAGNLPRQETFDMDLAKAICFEISESCLKNDAKGLVFNDRINNLPVKKDVWYEPYESKQISSRNFFIVAPTGGGKSVLLKKISRYFKEDGFSLVIIDLGGGFEVLSRLYPEDTAYIQYKQGMSLGINPFLINSIDELNSDKIDTLKDFILILWKKGGLVEDKEKVSLSKIIKDYYANQKGDYDFYSFYDYIKNDKTILERLNIEPEFFNIKEFLHICSEFYKDGTLEFLLRDQNQNQSIKDKKLIIFELESIRENYQVLPVVLSMIRDTIENVVWKKVGQNKMVVFEEAAKTLKFPAMFTAIEYYYQTIRKHDGSVGMVLQYINNIPQTDAGNAIVQNTHVLYLLEHDKGFTELQTRCNLSEHTLYQLKSLRNNLKSERPYTEFVLVRGKNSNVLRLELPREEYYCYLSEGSEKQKVIDYYDAYGDMERAITKIISEENL